MGRSHTAKYGEPKTLYKCTTAASFEYWEASLDGDDLNAYLQQDGAAAADSYRKNDDNAAAGTQGYGVMGTACGRMPKIKTCNTTLIPKPIPEL